MIVTILGCGSSAGVPMIGGAEGEGDWGECDPAEPRNRRTRASIVVEQGGKRMLVDTSPDLRTQLLECRIARVDAVLYTHAHADHVAGVDDVRALNRNLGLPLDAYGDDHTLDELVTRFGYAFQPWKPPGFFRPVLQPKRISPGQTVPIAGMDVLIFDQDHGFIRSLGLRIGDFAYSTDVVTLDESAFESLRGVETWVVGCFQRDRHTSHASLGRVLEWAARVQARRTILTHMGPDLDWGWMQHNLPSGMEAAFDGMVIEITHT